MNYRNSWLILQQKIPWSAVRKRVAQLVWVCCLCGLFFYLVHLFKTPHQATAYNFAETTHEESVNENKKTAKKQEPRKDVPRETKKEKNKRMQQEIPDKININQATKEMLMQLPHIGAKKAEDIIRYRETIEFTSIEDLMEVKGIGEKIFEKIAAFITV